MLHKAISEYLEWVDETVLRFPDFYVDYYTYEAISHERVNVRFRMRTNRGYLLEVSEALGIESDMLTFIDYRYHFQDSENRMVFRHDSAPHHRHISSFPHHKHLPDSIVESHKPDIGQVIEEAVRALHRETSN